MLTFAVHTYELHQRLILNLSLRNSSLVQL